MPDVINKRVKHRFDKTWYLGHIIGESGSNLEPTYDSDKGALQNEFTLYDIKYDGEEEIVHVRLEKDWVVGDIEIE